jgi:hypothetical protein
VLYEASEQLVSSQRGALSVLGPEGHAP